MIGQTYSVSQVDRLIKTLLTSNSLLKNVSISGEISNFKWHSSGHLYFSLKDENAQIRCVMFRSSAAHLKFLPSDGMQVTARGRIDFFEKNGSVQLYVNSMVPNGIGELYQAFEEMKQLLGQRGWFDQDKKKPLPNKITKVGIVTSSTGAAVRDMISVISRRDPFIDIVIVPALVQGTDAAESIASGIRILDERNDIDVIIVGRGGGSIEDLWAFNEMAVAEAIHNAEKIVISAVGHETDFTISDFTADLRAPTPSVAGELVSEGGIYRRTYLAELFRQIENSVNQMLSDKRRNLNQLIHECTLLNPINQIHDQQLKLDYFTDRIVAGYKNILNQQRSNLNRIDEKINVLNPQNILKRGYVIVEDRNHTIISDSKTACQKKELTLTFSDGSVDATVNGAEHGRKKI